MTIEIRDVLKDNDFTATYRSVNILPNKPTKLQLMDVLSDNGVVFPLTASNNFYLLDANGKGFVVIYNLGLDEFYYEMLSKAI